MDKTLHFCYTSSMTAKSDQPEPTAHALEEAKPLPVLRADAERNRQRIVEAARALFAERGLNVPLEEIAHRAQVGIATLYRRFPTREDLIAASFEAKMAGYTAAVEIALQAPDGWSGFCSFIEQVCAMQASDFGLQDVLTLTFPNAPVLEELRERAYRGFVEVVRRAQAEGTLRADFVTQDLILLLLANAGVINGTRDAAPAAWKRFVALVLQACRAEHTTALPPPPTHTEMYQAMNRLDRT